MNRYFADLNPLSAGEEQCRAHHRFGPAIRHYTLIHFVLSGKGVFETDGKRYEVHAGEAFLILPGKVTVYEADGNDPWAYRWIGFDGNLSGKFAELPPVFRVSELTVGTFAPAENTVAEYRFASALFGLYAELFAGSGSGGHHYVRRVSDYVRASYMRQNLRVEDIAALLNLDRRYLSRIFKQKTGESIQDYLISVRMEEAKRCLLRGTSVKETANLCGYADPFLFSKMFRRRVGVSPTEWKNGNAEKVEKIK